MSRLWMSADFIGSKCEVFVKHVANRQDCCRSDNLASHGWHWRIIDEQVHEDHVDSE